MLLCHGTNFRQVEKITNVAALMFLFIMSAGKLEVDIQEFTTYDKCINALRLSVEVSTAMGAKANGFCTFK